MARVFEKPLSSHKEHANWPGAVFRPACRRHNPYIWCRGTLPKSAQILSGFSKTRAILNKSYLLDKELGFGTKYIHPQLRISYPTLPLIAMKKKMRRELLSEELRVLYVALTRAKAFALVNAT